MIPEISLEDYSYARAKTHAAEIDRLLGFEFERTESLIQKDPDHQNWKDLPLQSLMTPYIEIRLILNLLLLKPQSRVIDLGSAYGRMAYVIAKHWPELRFVGYELERHRTQEALRVLGPFLNEKIQLLTQDLSLPEFQLPEADIYFIYDFGHPQAMEKTLRDLQQIAKKQSFRVVARGRGIRHQIHQTHLWLSEINSALHTPEFSIYTWLL